MIREDGLAPIRVDKARKLEIFYACVIKHVLDRVIICFRFEAAPRPPYKKHHFPVHVRKRSRIDL